MASVPKPTTFKDALMNTLAIPVRGTDFLSKLISKSLMTDKFLQTKEKLQSSLTVNCFFSWNNTQVNEWPVWCHFFAVSSINTPFTLTNSLKNNNKVTVWVLSFIWQARTILCLSRITQKQFVNRKSYITILSDVNLNTQKKQCW